MKAHHMSRIIAKFTAVVAFLIFGIIGVYSAATNAGQISRRNADAFSSRVVQGDTLVSSPSGRDAGFNPLGFQARFDSEGRYHQAKTQMAIHGQPIRANATAPAPILIDEPVQTFDVFAPPPTFQPVQGPATSPTLVPTNLYPVWSPDQSYIIFSSNRDNTGAIAADGLYHIWAVSAAGGAAIQVTTGTGNEYFPTLTVTGRLLAFTSDNSLSTAPATGTTNLYAISININFGAPGAPVDVGTLVTPDVLKTPPAVGREFGSVFRPAFSPGGDRIVFSAHTVTGPTAGHDHLYFLFTNSNGYLPQNQPNNPPVKLTDGPADDDNPAWSPDGQFVAFDSTATTMADTVPPPGNDGYSPTNAPTTTSNPDTSGKKSVWVIDDGTGTFGASPTRVTAAIGDSREPAWSYASQQNVYDNPNSRYSYLAFARAASPTAAHDIYYFRISADIQSGFAGLTPETASGGNNTALHLNTSEYNDAARTVPTTSYTDPGNIFDDRYPTWSPFKSVFSIGYQTNRSITYINPLTTPNPTPVEAALSLPQGTSYVGPAYEGIFESELFNVNPPTLLRFNGQEIVHINTGASPILPTSSNITGSATRTNISPNETISITARLSDREAAIDDNNVYVQIKDPDSKYQDSQGLEHKLFARDKTYNLSHGVTTDGSEVVLNSFVNGGFNIFNGFKMYTYRGAVGGWDLTDNSALGIGVDGAATGSRTDHVSAFIPWGPEYECQLINPNYNAPMPAVSDYRSPYYLAGFDDIGAYTGSSHPARPSNEWLKLTRAPIQDDLGGTLYTAAWTLPGSPSDYYLDVIAYDRAVFPAFPNDGTLQYEGQASNFRIYDNVWGFSSQLFNSTNDILVVSDYTLGQKFSSSVFGGQSGLSNLEPTMFGSESYITDIDTSLLPNSAYLFGLDPGNAPIVSDFLPAGGPDRHTTDHNHNGLGVDSYADPVVDDTSSQDGVPNGHAFKSNRYAIWRILSRGPVPQSVLDGYLPSFVNQPAINDNGVVLAARSVPDANRCVIWDSPFTGDLFEGPGGLDDQNTQNLLTNEVNKGLRLFVTGQDVAATLTANGKNGPGNFVYDTLSAKLIANTGGSWQTAGNVAGRISGSRSQNQSMPNYRDSTFLVLLPPAPQMLFADSEAPAAGPLSISNNDGFEQPGLPDPLLLHNDGSLSDYGPNVTLFNNLNPGRGTIVGTPDIIQAVNGATTDITYNPKGEDPTAGAGQPGLIYNTLASGGKTVFASFNLGAMSQDDYGYNPAQPAAPAPPVYWFVARNQRTNLIHNIVSYLRTGDVSGTVVQNSGIGAGTGISGATVYVTGGPDTGGTYVYSGITDASGAYHISGLEAGTYTVNVYRTGYASVHNQSPFVVEGDISVTTTGINLTQLGPGSIQGKVVDKNTQVGIGGATVKYVSSDQQVTETAITDVTGNYTISQVPVGTYNGTASDLPTYQTSAVHTVVVAENATVTPTTDPNVVFQLVPTPATISGRVIDSAVADPTKNGIAGATVTATLSTDATKVVTTTTDANGAYSFTTLLAGTYLVKGSAPGYNTQTLVISVLAADVKGGEDIALQRIVPAVPGTLGGLVTDPDGVPLSGATVTFTDVNTQVVVQTVKTGAVTTPAAPIGDGNAINYSATLPPSTYTVTVALTGYVTQTATATVTSSTFSRADIQLQLPPPIHAFPTGLSLVSSPYDYSGHGFDELLGKLNTSTTSTPDGKRSHVAVWVPQQLQYVLDPTPPADTFHLGVGYWIRTFVSTGPRFAGMLPTGDTVSVALHPGWNMIGVPSLVPISLSATTFANPQAGASPLTFANASSTAYNLVSPILYRYDQPTNTYQQVVATDSGTGDTRQTILQPWQGYWIRANIDCTIIIPTHG